MFELAKVQQLNKEQTDAVRRHLKMVFVHELDKTPDAVVLNAVHNDPPQSPVPGTLYRC